MKVTTSEFAGFDRMANHSRICRLGAVLLVMIILAGAVGLAGEMETARFVAPAVEAFEEGQGAWGVRRFEGDVVGLYDRVLVEDDGPGIGSDASWMKTDRAPVTTIAGDTRVKKLLHIERPGALRARLVAPANVGVEVNGESLPVATNDGFPEVPTRLLKAGDNAVVLRYAGGKPQTAKIALSADILRNAPERAGRPHRSFTSGDGGKTWAPVDGEYMVRLHLIQHVPEGNFISPVLDAGRLTNDATALLSPVAIEALALKAEADTPAGTGVELLARTGSSPVFDSSSWSDWKAPSTVASGPEPHRYLQWKAVLRTTDPLRSPRLGAVTVEARIKRVAAPAWAQGVKVVASHNERQRYTSMPFEYENPRHPALVALRQKHKLDEVVAGAKTETEGMVKLRDWVSRQIKYDPPVENYPAWDAEAILARERGFCVQYAITMMQCALSLGHQARFVFGHNPEAFDGGGHEVCEVWSNEHRKWVMYDVNQNWHYFNPHTRVPMSMLEVHALIAKTYYAGGLADLTQPPTVRKASDELAVCYGTSLVPNQPPAEFARHFVDGRYTVPTRWLFVNYLPRNNFLAHQFPQPKTQGTHWDWSEYWRWEDATTPRMWQYRNFTARRNDLNWSLNEVTFDATVTEKPGVIAVRMGTVTPYWETFLMKVDDQPWKPASPTLAWALHAGRNRLELRTRTQAGIEGPLSCLEVERAVTDE